MSKNTLKLIADSKAEWVDLRFTDTKGKEQHVTVSADTVDAGFFKTGKMFDGSSIAGWKPINESDMILMPDDSTSVLDVFSDDPLVILRCDIVEPSDGQGYEKDPRSVAKKAEAFMRSEGVADEAFFGPEPEFFVFDDIRWSTEMQKMSYQISSEEAAWETDTEYEDGNLGHRPGVKGGYFPVPPVDSLADLRAAACKACQDFGLETEVHHHEVGTAGQCEIGVKFNSLTKKADDIQTFKYCVHNTAFNFGKTATFMPKPLVGDNGSGMHCHQSLVKDGVNLFTGNEYGGLSQTALYYIGGIMKHARAINAFSNATTNSYKRLVPGFEAPVILTYSNKNRSASIRIPYESNPKAARIEVRFPDASGNPYFTFAAMLMAGLDGIKNKIDPGKPGDLDLYEASARELRRFKTVCSSLDEALQALDKDRAFLKEGGVFTDNLIDDYIALKMEEVDRLRMSTHPVEFDMYYSV
jgi:glutamine synthetase